MYLMNLDSVRKQNTNNLVLAETSLMRAALMNDAAVLTPNQAMDSLSLQEIILANNQSYKSKNSFCDAVSLGLVKIAIPDDKTDLIDCCLSSLSRGLDDPASEFIISGLKFLYVKDDNGTEVYPYSLRCEVTRYIIDALNNRKKKLTIPKPEWLTSEQKELIDNYIDSIILLDNAVKFYEREDRIKKNFPSILLDQLTNRLIRESPKSEVAELITRLIKECSGKESNVHRSYYYRVVDDFAFQGFSSEACSEVRSIIDVAYNIVMATSVKSSCELSVPIEHFNLSESIIDSDKSDYSFQTSYEKAADSDAMDWDTIMEIVASVNRIKSEKNYNWNDALNEYYVRESKVSGLMTIKYASFTLIKAAISTFVPGGFFVNFFQELIEDVVGDTVANKHYVPGSAKEIIERTKQSKKITSVLDTIIHTKN